MSRNTKRTPLFTSGERTVAGLAIVTAIVLSLSAQVVQSMVRPSLGLYDAGPAAVVAIPNVIEARPAV